MRENSGDCKTDFQCIDICKMNIKIVLSMDRTSTKRWKGEWWILNEFNLIVLTIKDITRDVWVEPK